MRNKTLYKKTPNKATPVQPRRSDSRSRNTAPQHPMPPPPPPPPPLLSPLSIAKKRPTKIKPFSSSPSPSPSISLQAGAKKKNSKMHTIRHALQKLKILLHLHHAKKIQVPAIVLTPPSECGSDGEDDDDDERSSGSLRRLVMFDQRMVSCVDLRLNRGDGG
ncbi:hypothetical protein B9Z19DRAFT_1071784 [Tuber borchii]|uniref:Uncharacterized protein n=1 Tax=Tuber borchii TaxID=42251 RepID=A0A2T7A7E2_TUBBO|nr:hypothetical protein B9Z19DRAFT_1071784 [Tuber borchii]